MNDDLKCPRCGSRLGDNVDYYDVVTCSKCGKHCQLTADHSAIATTTLEIHDVTHENEVPMIGESHG